ncbi:MAG: GntR family transcriptional regulator [Alcaligenes nematophilus]
MPSGALRDIERAYAPGWQQAHQTYPMRSSTEIADEILRRIQSGHYRPGDSLSQYELAEEFQTSRTPVREALRFLEARRVTSLTKTGRTIVAIPSAKSIREAFQIRAELEGLAAQLAVDWIKDSDLETLMQHQSDYARTLRTRVRSEEGSEWLQHNRAFHDLITITSHNERLHELIQQLQNDSVSSALSFASKMPPRLMEENILEHEAIIAALADRNGTAAREAMTEHVAKTMNLVLDWLPER